jgi:membrane protein implicated in regulation of membrane protease activity
VPTAPPRDEVEHDGGSPLEVFIAWLESLPGSVGDELAFDVLHVTGAAPGVRGAHVAALKDHALDLACGTFQHGGLAAAYAAIVDLALLRRATKEHWRENRELAERLRDLALTEREGEIARALDRALEEMEFVEQQWRAAAMQWKELRRARQSLEAINAWMWRCDLDAE